MVVHATLMAMAMAMAWLPAMATPPVAPALRVMTFNVRLPTDADGDNRWVLRREQMVRLLAAQQPDVIGTQELYAEQGDYLAEHLRGYAWFGEGRRGGPGDEHVGVLYRHDRLRVLASGDFWLSDTPDVPGSITWNHLYPRLATWALFQRKADGRRFYLFNTHLPYRDEDQPARVRGAALLRARIAALPAGVPVVVTGDFNIAPANPVHATLVPLLHDAWQEAAQREGPAATFHGFSGRADRRIDWILLRGLDVVRVATLDTQEAGSFPSDHFPVVADLAWPAAESP
ncbi:endonuclease [Lysobacter daejeonensis GH1-9]|uniref:Endonuclease n=1 Tax=Lysobacter daejeonensis GH1-9 TaxID=1385517 RepID=A0A0A0ERC4_9GAMM|nr:endonuclease [Lysobacter daejeonensis GH1-9]